MKRGLLAAVVCLSTITALLGADAAPDATPKAPAGKPKIKFDKTVYDFGKTSQVDKVTGTFVFRNVGDGVLKLGRPTTSCGCTVASLKPDVLQPGEEGELSFTLNLGRSRAILQKNISVDSNDPEHPKTLLLVKADYTPLYETRPMSFYLNLRKGDVTNVVTRVTRNDGKPFTISKIGGGSGWIEAKAEPEPNATNQTQRIIATLKPEGNPRYYTEHMEVFVDNAEQPAFNVTFTGRILGDLIWTPENLYWPVTDPTKAVTSRRLILRSSLPEKLEVKNISSTLSQLTVEPVVKQDGKTLELVAKLSSIPERSTNGVIRFETNVPSQPAVEVPVWINIVRR